MMRLLVRRFLSVELKNSEVPSSFSLDDLHEESFTFSTWVKMKRNHLQELKMLFTHLVIYFDQILVTSTILKHLKILFQAVVE